MHKNRFHAIIKTQAFKKDKHAIVRGHLLKKKIMRTIKNSVQLIGRLGKKPEIKTFESGKKMATFSLATNEVYKNNKGEKVEETQWHSIVVWGKKVEVVEKYLDKGMEIAVEGKLTNRDYEVNGEKKYTTEITMNDLLML